MSMSLQSTYNAAPAIGYEGMLQGNSPSHKRTYKNAEASASIPFGKAVVYKISAPDTDLDVLLPAAASDKVAGIVIHSHDYGRAWTDADGNVHGELDSTGLRPGTLMSVLRQGVILVKVPTGCAVGDRLWVRAVATSGEELGACENADDSTDMIDCTKQGQFLTSAAANGLAWLEVNFLNEPD